MGGSRYGIGFRGLGFREMGLEQLSEPSSSKQRDACEQTACGAVRSVCQSRHGGSSRFLRDPPGSCRLQSAWQLGMIMSSGAKFLWPHAATESERVASTHAMHFALFTHRLALTGQAREWRALQTRIHLMI